MCFDAIGQIGGAMVSADAQQAAQQQQEQTQANLETQGINAQLGYANTMGNAERGIIGDTAAMGNPYMEAAAGNTPPPKATSALEGAGGVFGPGGAAGAPTGAPQAVPTATLPGTGGGAPSISPQLLQAFSQGGGAPSQSRNSMRATPQMMRGMTAA